MILLRYLTVLMPLWAPLLFPMGGRANPTAAIEMLAQTFPAPKTQFVDENGFPAGLDSFKGKLVVLNIWATWCGPCVKEMPSLERLAEKVANEDIAVVAVSQDKGGKAVARPFLERIKVSNLPLYLDPTGRFTRDFGVRGMPTTFIISKEGLVVARLEGSIEWDDEEVVAKLRLVRGP